MFKKGGIPTIYSKLTYLAMNVAYQAHHGTRDVNGAPYIFHPFRVAEKMTDEISACVALLHDVAEDTYVSLDKLAELFPPEVVEPLRLLTHSPGEDYFDYVRKIKTDPVARAVKLADLADNSNQSRIVDPAAVSEEKKRLWREKYEKAKRILLE